MESADKAALKKATKQKKTKEEKDLGVLMWTGLQRLGINVLVAKKNYIDTVISCYIMSFQSALFSECCVVAMSHNSSKYARNIARLSAKIFGEHPPNTEVKSKYITQLLTEEPYYKKQGFTHYYPPVQDVRDFFSAIRHLGLFV